MDRQQIEQQIRDIQKDFDAFCALFPELEKSLQQWQKAQALMNNIKAFYESEEWLAVFEQLEQGEDISLPQTDCYSVMSEDGIWNALVDFDRLAWDWIKAGMKTVAPKDET